MHWAAAYCRARVLAALCEAPGAAAAIAAANCTWGDPEEQVYCPNGPTCGGADTPINVLLFNQPGPARDECEAILRKHGAVRK
jgi:hypothetical protein